MWAHLLLIVIQSDLTFPPMGGQSVNWTTEHLDTAGHFILKHGSVVANTPSPLKHLMD